MRLRVTDEATITESQIQDIGKQIRADYDKSVAVGSLVIGDASNRQTTSTDAPVNEVHDPFQKIGIPVVLESMNPEPAEN